MIDTHTMNAGPAAAAARELDDVAALRATLEHEQEHPRYEGGRETVLNAIQDRIGELATEAPPVVSGRPLRSGGSYRGGELLERTGPRRSTDPEAPPPSEAAGEESTERGEGED